MKTREPKFYNKNNELTRYGLACGYIEKKETPNVWKTLYMEHEHFHVQSGKVENDNHLKWNICEVFENDELTKARKLYRSIK